MDKFREKKRGALIRYRNISIKSLIRRIREPIINRQGKDNAERLLHITHLSFNAHNHFSSLIFDVKKSQRSDQNAKKTYLQMHNSALANTHCYRRKSRL